MENSDEEKELTLLEKTQKTLEQIQTFNTKSLVREEELGKNLSFSEAVEPAKRIVNLFKQISINTLEDFPEEQLNILINQANKNLNLFDEIDSFTTEQPNPHETRNNLLNKLKNSYQNTFNKIYNLISYSTSKSADFKRLENEANEMMLSVKEQADVLKKELENKNKESENILENIRQVSAEHGVSQEAKYFKETAEKHETLAKSWKNNTYRLALILFIYAIMSFFLHKINYFKPEDSYDTIQLAVSKVLIFAVISYLLYLSARNFIANKHNAVINKHRQTALVTFKSLVDAAESIDNKEIILTHASSCIFSPQPTGYSKESSSSPSTKSVIELLAKPFSSVGD